MSTREKISTAGLVVGVVSGAGLALGIMFSAPLSTLALLTAGFALGFALDRWFA